MDPLTPYLQKIDLWTENGRKIYESCTKVLSVTFDAVAGKHHVFLTALKNAADERCWQEFAMFCEDIHRVNLPLHAVELRQLPPYQLLEYLEKIWKVPRWDP
jgi:hypothetical protein